MRPIMLAVAFLIGLAGCQAAPNPQTVSDAQTAVDKIATAATTITASSSPILSEGQAAACAGQAVANTVTDMLTATGHGGAAADSADVSKALGYGCTWTLPAL